MICRYREKLYVCGDYLEANIYPVYKTARCRNKKSKPTKEVQQKLNEINAENKFIRICNANFKMTDYKVELTYRKEFNPKSEEEAAVAYNKAVDYAKDHGIHKDWQVSSSPDNQRRHSAERSRCIMGQGQSRNRHSPVQ